jgi:hypothetical protein
MANIHPRCQYPLGINTGVPAYDRMAATNNGIIVNASTIKQEELIQAQATNANQHCCNEPLNINSPLDGDSMLFHGEEMLNNIRENVRLLINQEIEKWDIEIYTFMCKEGQLPMIWQHWQNSSIIFVDYVMWATKLRSFPGGSLDVNKSVASQLTKNFTAHPEWHTLMQISLILQQQHKLQRQPTRTIRMN